MSVTHRDLASALGLSQATVSLALANDRRVAASTRERVQRVAQEMGYVPDPVLGSLNARRWRAKTAQATFNIAYLNTSPPGEFPGHEKIINGARIAAQAAGYSFSAFNSSKWEERVLDRMLTERGVRGILLGPVISGAQPVKLPWEKYSSLAVSSGIHAYPLHTVRHYIFEHFQLVWQRVQERGYRRIGVILPHEGISVVDAELQSAVLWLQRQHADTVVQLPLLTYPLHQANPPIAPWYNANRPDAIIGYAPNVGFALQKLGLRIPEDVAYGDLLTHQNVPFSGSMRNLSNLGSVAVEILIGYLRSGRTGLPEIPRTILIPPVWREGNSLPYRRI